MAHIAECMLTNKTSIGLNNFIARELSPHTDYERTPSTPPEEKEKYTWRMNQPTETRKYQLFPAKDKFSMPTGRMSPDPERAFAIAMAQTGASIDRTLMGNGMKAKKESVLNRRRKVSVPELGPMTTVHEIAMDSPTIPGRPPLHERSISAPGHSWRQHAFGEAMISCIPGPALDENAESDLPNTPWPSNRDMATGRRRTPSPKLPLSPKSLAPLVIPEATSKPPQRVLHSQTSSSKLRSNSSSADAPPEVPPKSPWTLDGRSSPRPRQPFTPMSSTVSLIHSANATPISAPDGRGSPSPWGNVHDKFSPASYSQRALGHRRDQSDTSIMDRGRPKKRREGSPMKETGLKRNASVDRRAFELLPQGTKAADVKTKIEQGTIDTLRKQAIGQAERFEVLDPKDVEKLSKELRALDERCEYLRKTHHSLRSGRRNLHDRICTYLRSPRTARFSHDAMLKQEEALAELDLSIDDWVSKLEQAENRRTRVRQKLLEHVAAALLIQPLTPDGSSQPQLQLAKHMVGTMGENTPPRSPTKAQSPGPHRLAEEVPPQSPPQHQSRPVEEAKTIEESPKQNQEQHSPESTSEDATKARARDIQSIRIYADSDVYALLADVEDEMNRMSEANATRAATQATEDAEEAEGEALLTLSSMTFDRAATPKAGTPRAGTPAAEKQAA